MRPTRPRVISYLEGLNFERYLLAQLSVVGEEEVLSEEAQQPQLYGDAARQLVRTEAQALLHHRQHPDLDVG